ncbi:MAG: hypothetical protein HWE16_11415 [Gammaproteobacteria bacterium]|nr:hypothetical protein [Gammaproteobacteria bacterium]
MSNKSFSITSPLREVLLQFQNTEFTSSSIIETYANAVGSEKNQQLSNFVYRQIHRLKKLNLVISQGKNASNKTIYKISERFEEQLFVISSKASHTTEIPKAPLEHLSKRLKSYEMELLTFLGEAEEYKLLQESTPQLADYVAVKFLESRSNSTKLIGKIRALKSVISECSV